MKAITKFLLVGAVAVMGVAISAAPSEAAKKKARGMAPGTYWGQTCTAPGSKVMVWGHDKKWYPTLWQTCATPFCPPACK